MAVTEVVAVEAKVVVVVAVAAKVAVVVAMVVVAGAVLLAGVVAPVKTEYTGDLNSKFEFDRFLPVTAVTGSENRYRRPAVGPTANLALPQKERKSLPLTSTNIARLQSRRLPTLLGQARRGRAEVAAAPTSTTIFPYFSMDFFCHMAAIVAPLLPPVPEFTQPAPPRSPETGGSGHGEAARGSCPWDDGPHRGVRSIAVTHKRFLESMRVEYADRNGRPLLGEKHGGGTHWPEPLLHTSYSYARPSCRAGLPVRVRDDWGERVLATARRTAGGTVYGPFGGDAGADDGFTCWERLAPRRAGPLHALRRGPRARARGVPILRPSSTAAMAASSSSEQEETVLVVLQVTLHGGSVAVHWPGKG
ncbi:hypothetical protein HU200_037062 [Digitaria exilis]|uniref:Jacalin-type lectin domain-containing protein n=1 Tax=Digitaria exilis TaxID=1010633 RepID=A0A835BFF7_9POAL|nr:hypothetical protein HU200_037062 [Digitaria exilis]